MPLAAGYSRKEHACQYGYDRKPTFQKPKQRVRKTDQLLTDLALGHEVAGQYEHRYRNQGEGVNPLKHLLGNHHQWHTLKK